MTLKHVYSILEELSATTKKKKKAEIIKKYKDDKEFKRVVYYAYDPFKRFHVTDLSYLPGKSNTVGSIYTYLEYLASKPGCTNLEKAELGRLSSIDEETNTIVNRIVKKDLRCGCSKRTFKKFFPDMPFFEIMTCQSKISSFMNYAKKIAPKNCKGSNIIGGLKKDGVRTWNIVHEDGNVEHTSRKGLEYPNFGIFDDEIIKLAAYLNKVYNVPYPVTIDGEAMDKTGKFNKLMKNVKRTDDFDDSVFEFYAFDIVDETSSDGVKKFDELDDFTEQDNRLMWLEEAINCLKLSKIKYVEHWDLSYIKYKHELVGLTNYAVDILGDEGMVFKIANAPYELKEKSRFWCKSKPVVTLDLQVVGFYLGVAGKKYEGLLGGLIVDYKGKEVRIGGGYSDKEREDFLDVNKRPSIIEVECKEVTPDGSLREPVFKRARDDKDSVDG